MKRCYVLTLRILLDFDNFQVLKHGTIFCLYFLYKHILWFTFLSIILIQFENYNSFCLFKIHITHVFLLGMVYNNRLSGFGGVIIIYNYPLFLNYSLRRKFLVDVPRRLLFVNICRRNTMKIVACSNRSPSVFT